MEFLIFLLDILFWGSLISIFWFWRKKNKKKLRVSIIAALVLFTLFATVSISQHQPNSARNTQITKPKEELNSSSTSYSETKEAAEETDENTDGEYTQKEIKKINNQLKLDLSDDQSSANNGDANYNWANWILKIEIQKNKTAKVWVDGNFVNLSEEARNVVGQKANGLIGRSIVTANINYSPEEGRNGVSMSFYNGPQAIGRSRAFNHSEFKWYH